MQGTLVLRHAREPSDPTLRAILEDPSVIKILHCGHGDLNALWDEYRVKACGVFDTGVADCLLRGRRFNQQRGLGDVLHTWLGASATPMQYKGQIQFTPGLFDERPLPRPELPGRRE